MFLLALSLSSIFVRNIAAVAVIPLSSTPLPAQIIDKGLPGPGLLAQIAISKYADHLPLYRQQQIFKDTK